MGPEPISETELAAVRAGLSLLVDEVAAVIPGIQPNTERRRVLQEVDGVRVVQEEVRRSYRALAYDLEDERDQFRSLEALLQLCDANDVLASLMLSGPGRGQKLEDVRLQQLAHNLMHGFVIQLVERADDDPGRFGDVVPVLLDSAVAELRLASPIVHLTAPLIGVYLLPDEVPIADGLSVRHANIDDLEPALNLFEVDQLPAPPRHDVRFHQCLVELRTTQRQLNQLTQQGVDPLRRVLDGIHLLTDARVTYAYAMRQGSRLLSAGRPRFEWSGAHGRQRAEILLDADGADMLRRVHALLSASPNSKRVKRALRRLNILANREDPEDDLIDAWVGLESLISPGMEGELTFRCAQRVATLIGANAAARQAMFGFVRESYGLRSRVAHGAEPNVSERVLRMLPPKSDTALPDGQEYLSDAGDWRSVVPAPTPLQQVADATRALLRLATRRFLEFPGTFDPAELDRAVLNGLDRDGPFTPDPAPPTVGV